LWLEQHGSEALRAQYRDGQQRRQDFRELTLRYRAKLQSLYASERSDDAKRTAKADLLAQLRTEYAQLKEQRWGGFAGYDAWFAQVNNASLGVLAAYTELAGDFERLFVQQDSDFERFYAQVAVIAALPKAQRHATLRAVP
jgi:predicted aminopeptidase